MAKLLLTERVEILEQKVARLETLPDRVAAVEVQIVQLRDEMRGEFSAVRAEMQAGYETLRREMREGHDTLRREIADGHEALRREIAEANEKTQTLMHVLHEDVIARIAMIQESRPARRKRR